MSAPTPVLRARLPYRPALDGLRAVAILGVLAFHLDPDWLPGGWLGVDLFFVLSGFLITTLLITEQDRWGRIAVTAFWRARMRRLLPALVAMLLAVVVAAGIWTVPGRRTAVATDILSAQFYVSNWRLILSQEQYFSQLALPSPVRHTWSLSIEEQFYLTFPLLLIVLAALFRQRRTQVAALAVIAAGSALWMAVLFVPGTDPVRAYYSTGTRAFELLIGAIGALVWQRSAFSGSYRWPRLVQSAAWIGLASVIAAMVLLDADQTFVFRGGLVLVCLASYAAIAGAASGTESAFQRLLGSTGLRGIGLISYPLYLWHWPVIIYLNSEVTPLSGWTLLAARVVLSFLLAWLTWRFIERPLRRRQPLIPALPSVSRWVVALAVPAVIVGAVAVGHTTGRGAEATPVGGGAILTPEPYRAESHHRAALLGNSIPASLAEGLGTTEFPQLTLEETTNIGCDPFTGVKIVDGKPVPPSADCLAWHQTWPGDLASHDPDVTVFFVPQTFVNDFETPDGVAAFGSPAHDAFIGRSLDEVAAGVADAKSALAVSTLACHNVMTFNASELEHVNDIRRVKHINKVVKQWADAHQVAVIDTFGALCSDGYSSTVNGVPLYRDRLHFTDESAPIYWAWMMPQVLRIADDANHEGQS